ncbi:MAG: hypothetical protein ACI9P5_003315 [Saprospiraceae bacterium]|jgi:hypothetical protein|tara:strand:+ start:598 stop:801 length:204 start_codon:yes stop_codon:yes gene_type:complete
MKKPSYIPVVIIIFSLVLFGLSSDIKFLPLQIKTLLVGKIGLVVGLIGLWIYTLLPIWDNSKNKDSN